MPHGKGADQKCNADVQPLGQNPQPRTLKSAMQMPISATHIPVVQLCRFFADCAICETMGLGVCQNTHKWLTFSTQLAAWQIYSKSTAHKQQNNSKSTAIKLQIDCNVTAQQLQINRNTPATNLQTKCR